MKKLLVLLVALATLAWSYDVALSTSPPGAHPLWVLRQEALHLSGLLSVSLMSLAMFLATRPAWLEGPLGGMDQVYRAHKWAGILAVAFAAMHWLIELAGDLLKTAIGRAGRLPKVKYEGLLEVLRDLAEDMGEWAIYGVLLMLAITLWRRFPYRPWRCVHRAMPVLYLMLALHAALLAPPDYWLQPVGALLAVLLAAGIHGAVRSLAGLIGRERTVGGEIIEVERPAADVLRLRCRLDARWRGHRAGQFAFVTFDEREGAHPFTIASADRGDRVVSFAIKALGDHTARLADDLHPGQPLRLEGPYGRFELSRCDRRAQQIWIAGGIGITPFLAWLESLQGAPETAPAAELHYCIRDHRTDAFVTRLHELCARLPSVRLQVHDSGRGDGLTSWNPGDVRSAEVWFCGPAGLAQTIRKILPRRLRFHQEAFAIR